MPKPYRLLLLLGLGGVAQTCARFDYEVLTLNVGAAGDHCADQLLDADETGIDCGGSCPACADGEGCVSGPDCASATCQANTCRPATCADGAQNVDETASDCGGSCAPCPEGSECVGASDCASNNCLQNVCQASSCSDSIQNQGEAAIDCGGPNCAPCPGCTDSVQNQDETGVDCGGSVCGPCPGCTDSVQNQDETGVDCGGSICGPCPGCTDSVQNQDETGVDCGGSVCGPCPTCSDGDRNQDETGIDCGGSVCPACVSCSDGAQNQDETGVDCGGSTCTPCGVNTPPLARMTVTPGVGSYDGAPATLFQGDASATTDREDSSGALTYSWDWDNDGVTDATGITATHTYAAAGALEARLTVQDAGGMSASTTFIVVVGSASNVVLVTTAAEEENTGDAPGSTTGNGLSLREAILYANNTPGRQSILVPAGFTIALDTQLPDLTDTSGVDIVGDGAILDGSNTGQNEDCIGVATPTRLFGFEIQNCSRSPLALEIGATGSQFSRLNIHDNDEAVLLRDTNVHFGPHNDVSRSGTYCLTVDGLSAIVDWNYIHDCPTRGVDLTGNCDGSVLLGNIISRSTPGIQFGSTADNIVFVNNVVHGSDNDGINTGFGPTGAVFRNNIFSNNVGYGLRAVDSIFAANDHNGYFGNTVGACTSCASLGAGSLTDDPRYMDATIDDFRLQSSSSYINAGIDTGYDVNGPAPGNGLFNGALPDIGVSETP